LRHQVTRGRVAGAAVVAIGFALCGCTAGNTPAEPTGPVPSAAEVRSLLGSAAGKVTQIADGRASVMIDVTPLVTGSSPAPGPADLDEMTVVAACVLSKSSGGPHGFATGVIPTDRVTPAIRAKAVADEYRSLLGPNCGPAD